MALRLSGLCMLPVVATFLTLDRLVATLGSKSSLKKITRKAIMDVNVSDACEVITDPSAPIALRLQGNLLYVSDRSRNGRSYR